MRANGDSVTTDGVQAMHDRTRRQKAGAARAAADDGSVSGYGMARSWQAQFRSKIEIGGTRQLTERYALGVVRRELPPRRGCPPLQDDAHHRRVHQVLLLGVLPKGFLPHSAFWLAQHRAQNQCRPRRLPQFIRAVAVASQDATLPEPEPEDQNYPNRCEVDHSKPPQPAPGFARFTTPSGRQSTPRATQVQIQSRTTTGGMEFRRTAPPALAEEPALSQLIC
jgi:hypothetical protein